MSLPSWMGTERAPAQPAIKYDFADSIHTAPGWRIISEDFYTCVRPVDCPPDPVFERLVHEFDPGAIFCWRKQLYLPPKSTQSVVVTHNALARHVKNPRRELQMFHVEMPRGAKHPKPNELQFVWERVDECLMHEGGPGGFMRWDGQLVDYLRGDFNVMKTARDLNGIRAERHVKNLEARRKARAEAKAEWDEFNAWLLKRLQRPGDNRRAYIEYLRKARAPKDRKAFVHLGSP